MSPTYELTQESKLVELPGNGRTIQVFRIRALKTSQVQVSGREIWVAS